MVTYKCTYAAGTDYQCKRVASRKIEGQWLCLVHLSDTTIPLKKRPPSRRAVKSSPEQWGEYNRLYRQNSRKKHIRLNPWPKKATPFSFSYSFTVSYWLIQHINGTEALYHCERCCEQVHVKRVVVPLPKTYHHDSVLGEYHYNKYCKISFKHQCKSHPYSEVKFIHCERCGSIGTKKKINHNRYPRGRYYHNLCLTCWQMMRPLFVLEDEESQLQNVLRDFKSVMRKTGMAIHAKSMQHMTEVRLPNYTENWYTKHPYL